MRPPCADCAHNYGRHIPPAPVGSCTACTGCRGWADPTPPARDVPGWEELKEAA